MMDIDHILIKGCPLCDIFLYPEKNIHTKLHHPRFHEVKFNDFIILDCDTCNIPMVIIRDHVTSVSSDLWGRVLYRCRKMFGDDVRLRTQQRKIKDHVHYHVMIPKRY